MEQTPASKASDASFYGISFNPGDRSYRRFGPDDLERELRDPAVFSWIDLHAPGIRVLNDLLHRWDIDLVLAFAEAGASDGARPLDADAYYARIGQAFVALLAERDADGYVYRVDLRLRPFGQSGRTALSFAAMEQYYQREGRDWERYAWIKARAVGGDRNGGARLLDTLRPFVFRRYLDYSAFAGLREMKALIDAEVARKDLAQNLKLGPGGIREIEFVVQLLQLIRGGREPSLRERGLLPALAACERLSVIGAAAAKQLRAAYRFLRRVENRVQMLRDEQTHELPDDADQRERIVARERSEVDRDERAPAHLRAPRAVERITLEPRSQGEHQR